MANQNKNLGLVLLLVSAGMVVLFFSLKQNNFSNKVPMQEVFDQKPSSSSSVIEKDPVPSPAIVTSPEHGQEAGFAVQVYSFKDEKRADVVLANLRKNGYRAAYIEISDLGERGTWYRVRIGGLENEAEAKALLETVRKNFKSGIIVKPKV